MSRRFAALVFALALAGCAATSPAPPVAATAQAAPIRPALGGEWNAVVAPQPGASFRLGLSFVEASPGVVTGQLVNLDTGAAPSALSDIVLAGDALSFRTNSGSTFQGAWDPVQAAWAGQLTSGGASFPAAFRRGPAPPLPSLPAVAGLDGRWEGKLQGLMTLVVRITTDASGTRAVMDSPDQQAAGLPVASLTRNGAEITLAIPNVRGTFTGTLSPDGSRIAGAWTQGASIPLTLEHVSADAGAAAVRNRPQTPQPPFPYRAEQVTVSNPGANLQLPCTLTLPQGPGPHPAAILITGSGAQDRDENMLGHKPFLVLADHLTRRGIAVLRCDDRDLIRPVPPEQIGSLVSDLMTDVKAELAFLRQRPDIDRTRIGLIGHSEGGVTAPRVAADDPDVAFVVMMAGIGAKGRDVLLEQRVAIARADGHATPEQLVQIRQRFGAMFDAMLAAPDDASALAAARREIAALPSGQGMDAATPEQTRAAIDSAAAQFASRYYRDLLAYDPAPVLARVRAPILAINGAKDMQVDAALNLGSLRRILAGRGDATIVELPGLNHLFQTAPTGAMSEYAEIEETFSPAALSTISDWVTAHTRR
jgi:dienelactone hydrolase